MPCRRGLPRICTCSAVEQGSSSKPDDAWPRPLRRQNAVSPSCSHRVNKKQAGLKQAGGKPDPWPGCKPLRRELGSHTRLKGAPAQTGDASRHAGPQRTRWCSCHRSTGARRTRSSVVAFSRHGESGRRPETTSHAVVLPVRTAANWRLLVWLPSGNISAPAPATSARVFANRPRVPKCGMSAGGLPRRHPIAPACGGEQQRRATLPLSVY